LLSQLVKVLRHGQNSPPRRHLLHAFERSALLIIRLDPALLEGESEGIHRNQQ
jgi:hypothetical protein